MPETSTLMNWFWLFCWQPKRWKFCHPWSLGKKVSTKSPASHEKINKISWQKKILWPLSPLLVWGPFTSWTRLVPWKTPPYWPSKSLRHLVLLSLGDFGKSDTFSEFPFIEGLKFPCGFWEGGFLQFRIIMAHLVSGLEVGRVMGLQREEPRKNFHSEITGSTYDYKCILWCGVYYPPESFTT